MADLRMTAAERDAFLDEVHVGVVAVPAPDRAPVTTPVWFRHADGLVHFVTEASTEKGALLAVGTPFSLTSQDGVGFGAAYVTVECLVESIAAEDGHAELRRIADRYLGVDGGDLYMATYDPTRVPLAITARATRYLSRDYVKLGLVGSDGT